MSHFDVVVVGAGPGVEPLLQQLQISLQNCPRHLGHWVHWDGPPRFNAFSTGRAIAWQGFQVSRALLDQQLLERAQALGNGLVRPPTWLALDCSYQPYMPALDPCASHGVIKALMSGLQAASAIVDCLFWPAGEATVQAAYQAWVQKTVQRDVLALRDFYRAHPYPPAWL